VGPDSTPEVSVGGTQIEVETQQGETADVPAKENFLFKKSKSGEADVVKQKASLKTSKRQKSLTMRLKNGTKNQNHTEVLAQSHSQVITYATL
jgi:hypothetical protein